MKKLLSIILLLSGFAFGAAGDLSGNFVTPENAYTNWVAMTGTGTTATFDVSRALPSVHSLQLNVTGSPTTCKAQLEGSQDGVNWTNLSGSYNCTSTIQVYVTGKMVSAVRVNITALSGGTSPTVTPHYNGSHSGGGVPQFDVNGLLVHGITTGFNCVVTVSTATTIQAVGGSCVAPGAGLSLYITDIEFGSSAAGGVAADSFPTLKSGTGGTCGSGTAVVWQGMITANGNLVVNLSVPIKITANNELCWIMTTAGSKTVQVHGFIAP